MPTQTAIEVQDIDCNYHARGEPCPGEACANGWHRFTAWMRNHCATCGAPAKGRKRIDLGGKYYSIDGYADCRPEMHRLWLQKPCKIKKPKSAKAKFAAKPLDHYQITHNLFGWYSADKDADGLAWLVAHNFLGETEKAAALAQVAQ